MVKNGHLFSWAPKTYVDMMEGIYEYVTAQGPKRRRMHGKQPCTEADEEAKNV